MYSKRHTPAKNISFWTPSRIIFSTVILTLLIGSGSCCVNFVTSLFLKPVSAFPTSIPWIHSEAECKHTKRMWQDNQCWDYEHSMTF